MTSNAKVVTISYDDLISNKDLSKEIEEGFGSQGLGIIVVSGVPKVLEYREALLPLARKFALLDDEIKAKYEHKESSYSFGWSHGKEKFKGKIDVMKGSFYNNPQYDVPTEDPELIKKYPRYPFQMWKNAHLFSYASPNIWPSEIPELEKAFKNMGQLIVHVGMLLAKHCDAYVHSKVKSYPKDKLYNIIKDSKTCKARLLYYFPDDRKIEERKKDDDSWCGLHLDHGSLTGLTSALYLDKDGNVVKNEDESSGLFITTREGKVVKAKWSPDCLAFQIGESSQIHTGGVLVATPHEVRSGNMPPGVSRSTLAVFMQPQWDYPMSPPEGYTIEQCKVKALEEGMDFNAFTEKRLQEYY